MLFAPERYLSKLAELAGEFEQVLREVELSLPVPTCGEWTLRDLGAHLGATHRWAAEVVRTGEPVRELQEPADEPIADWYAASAAELLNVLGAAKPEATCWGFGPEKVAGFWFRRQVQETLMHLWDARSAAALMSTMEPPWAADGVDEVLTTMLPKVGRWVTPPKLAAPLVLRAADDGSGWLLHPAERDGEPPVAQRGAAPDGVTTVTASAQDLLLLLWKRRSTADVRPTIVGEPGVAADFLEARMTP